MLAIMSSIEKNQINEIWLAYKIGSDNRKGYSVGCHHLCMIRWMISKWSAVIPYHELQSKIQFGLFNCRRSTLKSYRFMIVAFLQVDRHIIIEINRFHSCILLENYKFKQHGEMNDSNISQLKMINY